MARVHAVHAEALDVLDRLGFRRIEAVGQPFNPARHEADRVVESDGVEPGTVVEVHRAGFVDTTGRLMRPAVVTVVQAPAASRSSTGKGEPSGGREDR